MITTAIFAGTLTAIGFLFLAMKFGNGFVKTALGYAWLTDITVTFGCIALFAMSGTISGLMTGIVTGVIASLGLSIARKMVGYRTLRVQHPKWYLWQATWEDHEGPWADKATHFFSRVSTIARKLAH